MHVKGSDSLRTSHRDALPKSHTFPRQTRSSPLSALFFNAGWSIYVNSFGIFVTTLLHSGEGDVDVAGLPDTIVATTITT